MLYLVRRRTAPNRRGMALLDVIVGTVMLGIGLAVVVSISSRSLAGQRDGEMRMVATWLADELLSMVLVEGPVDYRKLYDLNGSFYPPFEDYAFDITIEDIGIGQPFRVTAKVSWLTGRAVQSIEVQAYIAERGGDPFEPRAPKEWLDREGRHYERLFGE
ncbi:MAG TPA: hypothetical protein PK400_09120 [Phycisphaerales bacterium]|nr:hypothetical protein [Phycisphaerales bacterium]HRQ75055.1 hypothetical protein [Phycisphaerales bacterium]